MPTHLKDNLEHILTTCFNIQLDEVEQGEQPEFDFKTIHFGCYGRYCMQVSGIGLTIFKGLLIYICRAQARLWMFILMISAVRALLQSISLKGLPI